MYRVLSRFYRVNVYGREIIQPWSTLWFQSLWTHVENPSISLPVPGRVYHLFSFLELCSGFLVYQLRPSLLIDIATLTCIDVPSWWTVPSLEVFVMVLHLKLQGFCTLFTSSGEGHWSVKRADVSLTSVLSGVPTTELPYVLFLSSPFPGSMSHQGLFLVCSCQALTDVPCCAISSGLIEAIALKHSLASLLEPR